MYVELAHADYIGDHADYLCHCHLRWPTTTVSHEDMLLKATASENVRNQTDQRW